FRSSPASKRPVNSRLAVAWGANFGGFGGRIRDFFSPPKQAPLPPGIRPIKVKDIWSKDENFGTSQMLAVGLHVAAIGLLVIPIFTNMLPASTEAKNKQRSEEHTSELQSRFDLVCRLLLEKKKK